MQYIYKLLDETTLELLKKNDAISLSRPFMHYYSEKKGFKVFDQVMNKLKDGNLSVTDLCADTKLIESVDRWVDGYKNSLPTELKSQHPPEFTDDEYLILCVKSDIEIAMSHYYRTYCGYFTSLCLEDESTRVEYINNNVGIAQGKEYCVKIPIEHNHMDLYATSWKKSVNNDNYYIYHKELNSEDSIDDEEAVLHIHCIKYASASDLKLPWVQFNGHDNRRVSSLLQYVDEKYYSQDEQRLMLHIPKKTHSIVENKCSNDSTGESMIKKICNICLQALQYPKYVYLMVDGYEVFKIPDSELKH